MHPGLRLRHPLATAEELGEAAQAPERPGLDGSKRNAQVRGDLRLGEATEVCQHQDFALLVGQAGECGPDLMGASVALGQVAAVLTGNIVQVVQRDCGVAPTAQMIDGSLAGDTEHPGGQASGGVVAAVVSPDLVEDQLEDVVGVIVANQMLQVAANGRAQGDIDLADRLLPVVNELCSEVAHGLVDCEHHCWPRAGRPREAQVGRCFSATGWRRSSSPRPPHTPYAWRLASA
jgi:hypothetical protein